MATAYHPNRRRPAISRRRGSVWRFWRLLPSSIFPILLSEAEDLAAVLRSTFRPTPEPLPLLLLCAVPLSSSCTFPSFPTTQNHLPFLARNAREHPVPPLPFRQSLSASTSMRNQGPVLHSLDRPQSPSISPILETISQHSATVISERIPRSQSLYVAE